MEPAQLPNFETQARRLRYQALGTACRNDEIPYLFVAHHEDDQAESLLLRLVRGAGCMGLQGIQPLAGIPECEGIYGVHESGGLGVHQSGGLGQTARRSVLGEKLDLLEEQQSLSMPIEAAIPVKAAVPVEAAIPFENGGITVHRPLLEFSKDRLIATCQALGVKWVEDKTNHDPTSTPRNAIRYLLRDGRLPQSLQKPSLLALRSRMITKATARIVRADKEFERCRISMLDTRSGGLVVRLPNRVAGIKPIPLAYHHQRIIETEYKASLMLRQLLNIVSPQKDISLQSLKFAVDSMYPDAKNPNATTLDKLQLASTFCVGGVAFRRVHHPMLRSENIIVSKSEDTLDQEFLWVLNRQPFTRDELPTIHFSPAREARRSTRESHDFQLWDSRYWIRVHNHTPFTLRIQPLRLENLRQLRSSLPVWKVGSLNRLLRVAAPGKIRWTLPVLLREEQNGTEEVIALPTLGQVIPNNLGVKWEVRFKRVTLPKQTDVDRVVI